MKIAVLNDRAVIVDGASGVDIATASDGVHGPDLGHILESWPAFSAWAGHVTAARQPLVGTYDAPTRMPPRQVFGIGINYADHAGESGFSVPTEPMVFTKFPSSIVGPSLPLQVTLPAVDWEAELVVVIGRSATDVTVEQAWSCVAGLTIGQDISDRTLQMRGSHPQFNLGKSRRGYGPIGPWLVTPDELANRDDLAIECTLNGEVMQHARTSQLIYGVPALVSYLSSVVTLWPGDLIFTGTPAGVGFMRQPPRFLQPGDRLVTRIEGLGELVTEVVR